MEKINNILAEDTNMLNELVQKLDIKIIERLVKGHEKKFYIETLNGDKRLLRINDIKHYEWTKNDACAYNYITAAGINVMRLIDMDVFFEGTLSYQLFTWYDGNDLVDALPSMKQEEQFSVGIKTGNLLRKLHALPPLFEIEPWSIRYKRIVQEKIKFYEDNTDKTLNMDLLAYYLQDNLDLLSDRPQTFTHGDFNTENIMYTPDGQIGLIDLGGGKNSNDPWWDFCEIPNDLNMAPHFYIGLFKGYFKGEPPLEFFHLLSYYIAFGAFEGLLDSTCENASERIKCVLNWFNDMKNSIPSWYLI